MDNSSFFCLPFEADCCLSLFCNPCTLAQMRIHVEAGEKGFFSAPDVIEELSTQAAAPAVKAPDDAKGTSV